MVAIYVADAVNFHHVDVLEFFNGLDELIKIAVSVESDDCPLGYGASDLRFYAARLC